MRHGIPFCIHFCQIKSDYIFIRIALIGIPDLSYSLLTKGFELVMKSRNWFHLFDNHLFGGSVAPATIITDQTEKRFSDDLIGDGGAIIKLRHRRRGRVGRKQWSQIEAGWRRRGNEGTIEAYVL